MNYGGRKMPAKCNSVYIVQKKIDKCSMAIYTREWKLNQMFKKNPKNNTVSLDYLENMKKYHTDVRLALFFKI